MTNKYILTCTCPHEGEFAETAYKLLFPDTDVPEILSSDVDLEKLLEQYQGSDFGEKVKALKKSKVKFAYYFEVEEGGNIIDIYNLKTGGRVC